MSNAIENVEPDPLIPFVLEIESVTFSPRFQVIVTNGVLEMFVNTLIENKCKDGKKISDNSYFTYSIKLTLLYEAGLISEIDYKRLKAFKKLRDKAAHGSFNLAPDWIQPFEDMLHPTLKNRTLKNVCMILVFNFFNSSEVFHNYFSPIAANPK